MIQQTLFIDHLGGTTNTYQPLFFGSPAGGTNIITVDSTKSPLHVGAPFWSLFLEKPHESSPKSRPNFNYSSFADIKPPYLDIPATHVETTHLFNIEIKNVGKDNIQIYDVYSPSRDFFFSVVNNTAIKPGEVRVISFYYCPTQTGHFDTSFLISTSKGDIPYPVSHYSYSSTPENARPTLQYITQENQTFHFDLPPALQHQSTSISYDGNIFTFVRRNRMSISMSVNPNMKVGYYVTFIHSILLDVVRTFPIFMIYVQKPLQHVLPAIVIDTLTHKGKSKPFNVSIINPTNRAYNKVKLSLCNAKGITFHDYQLQRIRAGSTEVVGSLVVDGSKEGSFETSLLLSYDVVGYKSPETVSFSSPTIIPVKYKVVHGKLDFSEKKIEVMQNAEYYHNISFVNRFKTNVFVLSISVNSTLFTVGNMVPFIVKPGQRSPNITVKIPFIKKPVFHRSFMKIETNITTTYIPVTLYDGNIKLTDMPNVHGFTNEIMYFAGLIPCQTVNCISFYLENPNPNPFTIIAVDITDGISLDHFMSKFINESLIGETFPPFSSTQLTIEFKFNEVDSNLNRNDTINIFGEYSNAIICINWTPQVGKFTLFTDIEEPLVLGNKYTGKIYVNSTYNENIAIMNLTSINGDIDLNITSTFAKNEPTVLGTFSFELNQNMLYNTALYPLLSPHNPWYEVPEQWDYLWQQSMPIKFHFALKHKTAVIHKTLKFDVIYSIISDSPHEFGLVNTNTNYTTPITLFNTLDSPLHLVFYPPKLYASALGFTDEFEIVIKSGETVTVHMDFKYPYQENVTIVVPVVTNGTAPFSLTFNAEVRKPSIDLVDDEGNSISVIKYNRTDDSQFIGRKWKQLHYLRNLGETTIDIKFVSIDNRSISLFPYLDVLMNCTDLHPGEECPVEISVNIDTLPQRDCLFSLIFESCGYHYIADLSIYLSDQTAQIIENTKKYLTLVISALALSGSFIRLIKNFRAYLMNVFIRQRKDSMYEETVKKLSVSSKTSIATQCIIVQDESCGGGFTCDNSWRLPQVSPVAIDYLSQFLNK